MKTLKIYITGTVQGIFFRKFIEERANELRIRGFVRNLDDGRVEVIIEGDEKKIEEMINICRQGSPHSTINNIEIQELKHQGFNSFKVLRM